VIDKAEQNRATLALISTIERPHTYQAPPKRNRRSAMAREFFCGESCGGSLFHPTDPLHSCKPEPVQIGIERMKRERATREAEGRPRAAWDLGRP
jgi:hypothetical protein